jgi:hypothetical protein
MPINQKGIATIFIPVFLVLAVVLGIYLVQNRTNILPQASHVVGPETSFSLNYNQKVVKPGDTFQVDVMMSSDFDAANTFSALINYPSDKLEVVKIDPPMNSSASASLTTNLALVDDSLVSKVAGAFDSVLSRANAQSAQSMPTISGKAYCSGGKPVVELNWAKVQTNDLEYLFMKTPDGKAGVTVSTLFDRYQYPIKDTGFISPVKLGTAYTYHLESFSGAKSNSVTITTPSDCSATPTPTPTPTATPTPTPTPTPSPTPKPSPSVIPSATPQPACGIACASDGYCTGAKDGCTFCLPNSNSTQKVCAPAPSPSPTPTYTYFIKKWIEQSDDKKGLITLSGAVPNPGFKTEVGKKALMATITFRAKANGEASLDFNKDGTAIYRNSDNQNILTVTRGIKIPIGGVPSSGTPIPSPTPTLTGSDGTWCLDSDQNTGGYKTKGSCSDSSGLNKADYCEGNTSRDGYCSGTWDGKTWTKVHCEFGGYVCTDAAPCSEGVCGGALPSPSPSTFEVKVINPNGGESYRVGDKVAINWKTAGNFDYCTPLFRYATDQEGMGRALVGGDMLKITNGNYVWVIPSQTGALTNQLKIVVSCFKAGATKAENIVVMDESDAYFTVTTPVSVNGKRADLYKDSKKPDFINDQDISVFFSKCAEKGVELFGQPASVQPVCDIFEDGKITVSDWAVLVKFRNQSVAQ